MFIGHTIKSTILDNAVFITHIDFTKSKITTADILYCNFYRFSKSVMDLRKSTTARKIGKTTFIITTSFSDTASETAENILVRYVSNQILKGIEYHGTQF